ncbi:MAG: cytochrome b/b6 domain-containing protein [Alphaproteobacteria bacterium]|nr:cytochrome b/b6 domain-containing protein [Alphaproteobacteria bacterium]
MLLRNTKDRFGLISKSFHWIMAILILMMLAMGFKMVQIPPGPDKLWVVMLHKSLGLLILMLACGRLLWRLASPRPDPTPTLKWWEDSLARIVHALLYVAFFAMPLSGWVMSSAGRYPVLFFGIEMPRIAPQSRAIMEIAREIHDTAAFVLIGLLALHFAGALKHHFIDRDATLKRMTYNRLGFAGGAVLALIGGAGLLLPLSIEFSEGPEEAQEAVATVQQPQAAIKAPDLPLWTIDKTQSFIKFQATQYGQTFEGKFPGFDGQIYFDPAKPERCMISITIPMTMIDTGSADRDKQAAAKEWFWTDMYKEAVFETQAIEQGPPSKPQQYTAHGRLTLRGVTKEIDLPFTLDIHDGLAEMRAELALSRLDFGIGQGEWAKTDAVGDAVKISVYVKATPSP